LTRNKKLLVCSICAVLILGSSIPVVYGILQRQAISSLQLAFNRIELERFEIKDSPSLTPIKNIIEGKSDTIQTAGEVMKIATDASYKERVTVELLANTEFTYDLYVQATNTGAIPVIVDKTDVIITISGHQLPQPLRLSSLQTIEPGASKEVKLEGLTFALRDVADVLLNTVKDDFRLTIDLNIVSHYPTLFGDMDIYSNVHLKTFLIPPKPTFNAQNGFQYVSQNVNSYTLAVQNDYEMPLSGKLQIVAYKGAVWLGIGCNPSCTPLDNGFWTLARAWVEEDKQGIESLVNVLGDIADMVEPVQVHNRNMDLAPFESTEITLENPDLKSSEKSAFVLRWEPDFSKIPYSVTVSLAGGNKETKYGNFELGSLQGSIGKFGTSILELGLHASYYVTRDFGYVGHKEFVSAKTFLQTSLSNLAAAPSTDGQSLTVSGKLSDEYGEPIVGQTVTIRKKDLYILHKDIGTSRTDSEGIFKFEIFPQRQLR
jgi:hypothetical protein